jgi:hypothetical protein
MNCLVTGQGSRVKRVAVRGSLLAVLVLAAGCTDVQAPRRSERYEWRLDGTESFHWPREALPVRVWVEDDENLPEYAAGAIADWKAVFLYGELDARVVSDSNAADVLVRLASPPGAVAAARLLRPAPECQGATDLDILDGELQLPVRVYVTQRLTGPDLPGCSRLTLRHELGHAFGIWNHSADPADAMFTDPELDGLSEADRHTMEYLYHFPPTVVPAR